MFNFLFMIVVGRGAFLFRQPPQSSVSNVFLLPFSRGVWAACALVFAAAGALLAALSRPRRLVSTDPSLVQLTPAEAFTFAIGTICQQGELRCVSVHESRRLRCWPLARATYVGRGLHCHCWSHIKISVQFTYNLLTAREFWSRTVQNHLFIDF